MNREEAITTLKNYIEKITGGMFPGEREILVEAFDALRSPQPDPITGLMPCGCGHCWDAAQAAINYVIAVEDNRGIQYLTCRPIPYNYCPSCGRDLRG